MDLLVGTVYQVSGVARGSFLLQKKSNATTINGAIIVLSIALFNITLDFFYIHVETLPLLVKKHEYLQN